MNLSSMCASPEIHELADHGITLPPNMQGLTDDQITDLKLKDEWEEKCIPSGGAEFKKDEIGCRNGHGKHPVQLTTWLFLHLNPTAETNFPFLLL